MLPSNYRRFEKLRCQEFDQRLLRCTKGSKNLLYCKQTVNSGFCAITDYKN